MAQMEVSYSRRLDYQYMIDVMTSMMFPKCSKKHILMGSLNVLKEGVFNGIEMA